MLLTDPDPLANVAGQLVDSIDVLIDNRTVVRGSLAIEPANMKQDRPGNDDVGFVLLVRGDAVQLLSERVEALGCDDSKIEGLAQRVSDLAGGLVVRSTPTSSG